MSSLVVQRQLLNFLHAIVFKDEHTQDPFVEAVAYDGPGEGASMAQPDHIYLDAMGFGMGCCCLQMTFQGRSIDEARYLYDQLAVMTPIMLALSGTSMLLCIISGITSGYCSCDPNSTRICSRSRLSLGHYIKCAHY